MKGRGSLWAGVLVALAAVVLVVVLGSGDDGEPFRIGSSDPAGYRALAILMRDAGIEVDAAPAAGLTDDSGVPGDAFVVPVADRLTEEQLAVLEERAASGATVVLAAEEGFSTLDSGILTRTPAVPVRSGVCTIAELESLQAVDNVSLELVDLDAAGEPTTQQCFTDAVSLGSTGAVVTIEPVGNGRIVHLASPYVWANARLAPDKERGGEPLDNGSMALALLKRADSVLFVRTSVPEGATPDGTRNPLGLLPANVKLALVQLGAAFGIYAWWRGRRLIPPVRERIPVEVAGSELVEAVGGLLRRHGSVGAAAAALRDRECRALAVRLGVPREAGRDALVSAVAARSGRNPNEVGDLLFGPPPRNGEGLVALCDRLDRLHTEVLDVQPAP